MAVLERSEKVAQIRVIDRLAGIIGDKVLFRHIGYIVALVIFGQKVIKRLIFLRAAVFGNVFLPFIRIRKHCIHIEYDPPKGMLAMADNLSKMVLRPSFKHDFMSSDDSITLLCGKKSILQHGA
jgi:hypothetical protein